MLSKLTILCLGLECGDAADVRLITGARLLPNMLLTIA